MRRPTIWETITAIVGPSQSRPAQFIYVYIQHWPFGFHIFNAPWNFIVNIPRLRVPWANPASKPDNLSTLALALLASLAPRLLRKRFIAPRWSNLGALHFPCKINVELVGSSSWGGGRCDHVGPLGNQEGAMGPTITANTPHIHGNFARFYLFSWIFYKKEPNPKLYDDSLCHNFTKQSMGKFYLIPDIAIGYHLVFRVSKAKAASSSPYIQFFPQSELMAPI